MKPFTPHFIVVRVPGSPGLAELRHLQNPFNRKGKLIKRFYVGELDCIVDAIKQFHKENK